jgi:preprotein translocase subunit SecD
MLKKLNWKLVAIICVIGISTYFVMTRPIKKGLDITGGTQFTIEVAAKDWSDDQKKDAMEETLAVYRNRIDEIGVAGTTVQQLGADRIVVQVPGIETEEAQRITRILTRQAFLEFKLVVKGPEELI